MSTQITLLGNGNTLIDWYDGSTVWSLTSSVAAPGTFHASIRNGKCK